MLIKLFISRLTFFLPFFPCLFKFFGLLQLARIFKCFGNTLEMLWKCFSVCNISVQGDSTLIHTID